jgi:hypothetical protein
MSSIFKMRTSAIGDNNILEWGNMPQQWIIIYRMRKYATTVDDNIQEWGNMPQQCPHSSILLSPIALVLILNMDDILKVSL